MTHREYHWEPSSSTDEFQVSGRKLKLINKSGDEIILEIGDEFWIVDEATGREGQNVFFLQQAFEGDSPFKWSPMLTVHLPWEQEIIDYAEENCWGNLNADEQREMAECPVVAKFAGTGSSTDGTMMCPRCKFH